MLSGPKLRLAALLAVVLAAGWYLGRAQRTGPVDASPAIALQQTDGEVAAGQSAGTAAGDPARAAFERRDSGTMITVSGVVERTLADDRDGSPHQRFIIRTPSGLGVLVAHNLDLAPRLEGLAAGDRISVLGQYEWNEKGGVMHWTHGDPAGRHATGYIEWHGRLYQ